jgi:hypothetical protein
MVRGTIFFWQFQSQPCVNGAVPGQPSTDRTNMGFIQIIVMVCQVAQPDQCEEQHL